MTITYRQTKGSALLYGEVDENFRDLYEDTDLQRVLTNGNTSNLAMTVEGITCNTANVVIISATGFVTNTLNVPLPTTPASATATGTQGQIVWDADYIYVCVATNTWKRAAISTWV